MLYMFIVDALNGMSSFLIGSACCMHIVFIFLIVLLWFFFTESSSNERFDVLIVGRAHVGMNICLFVIFTFLVRRGYMRF